MGCNYGKRKIAKGPGRTIDRKIMKAVGTKISDTKKRQVTTRVRL